MRAFEPQTLEAPAKVNLCLAISYPPREDGYHSAESLMLELCLHDTLTFSSCSEEEVFSYPWARTQRGTAVGLHCPGIDVAVESNLIFRAIDGMETVLNADAAGERRALLVKVDKHIPAGGGMGGGSSDAAAAIKAIAKWHGVDCKSPACCGLASNLGADIPFFLFGGCALMGDKGDVLERELPVPQLPIVLMGEKQPCPTGKVYAAFDASPVDKGDASELAAAIAGKADLAEIASLCDNNLSQAAFATCPGLEDRVRLAQQQPGVLKVMVSGSGSTSFAICASEEAARNFAAAMAEHCDWVQVDLR